MPAKKKVTILQHHFKDQGVSLAKDKDGFFVCTHRARSKSYPDKDKIPKSVIKRIESTG